MKRLLRNLWKDDVGAIVSIELLFLFVVLTLGTIAGWTNVRAAVNSEMTETANSLLALDQSYSIADAVGCNPLNVSYGSRAIDADSLVDWAQTPPGFISIIDVDACP